MRSPTYFLILLCPMFALILLPATSFGQSTIERAFSPHQGATELVVNTIGEAHRSISMAAYSFTSRPIAEALVDACNRGVDVRVVLDKSQRTNALLSRLFDGSCVHTRINYRYAIMHDKFIIVDDDTVELGSFNYTKAAENNNAENVLVLHDVPTVAHDYGTQWIKLWDESQQ